MGINVTVPYRVIGEFVMFHMHCPQDPIRIDQRNRGNMPNKFIKPAQRLASARNNIMLRFMGRQVRQDNVQGCNGECQPERHDIQQHQWEERNENHTITQSPGNSSPRNNAQVLPGDFSLEYIQLLVGHVIPVIDVIYLTHIQLPLNCAINPNEIATVAPTATAVHPAGSHSKAMID